MPRILFYEPSFHAIKDRLPAGAYEPLLMAPDGTITLNGQVLTQDEARPEVGWTNTDLFNGPVREYMRALRASKDLKWLQSAAAGFDGPIFAELVRRGVRLTTNSSQGVSIADYVVHGVLDHYQRAPERRAAQTRHEWKRFPFREIDGGTWLVAGFGAIGQQTARRARAFGAKVIGARRTPGPHDLADEMITPDQIVARLPEADVVVLSIPLSRHTAGMVDAAFLAAMKPRSVFVNVGRGPLVDEAALLAALDRGTPEHAVLDVFHAEPLPPESPFWAHPRVAVSPHGSALGSGLEGRTRDLFVENLGRYLDGRPLLNEAAPSDVTAD